MVVIGDGDRLSMSLGVSTNGVHYVYPKESVVHSFLPRAISSCLTMNLKQTAAIHTGSRSYL